ncbi:hypothetical protein [Actinomadura formosensis]|uniref:hypothetical protein n=1 Tax=Actinomadura formosensis TaxID=60706 RepID=UPI003D8A7B74
MAPSKELRAHAEKIAETAGEMSSEPLSYMKVAHEYTEKACDLNPLAFGVICHFLFSSSYESSRSTLSNSIDAGAKQLKTASEGLVKVANTIAKAEIANSADTRAKRAPKSQYTKPSSSWGFAPKEGALTGAGWAGAGIGALLAKNIAIATANGASKTLAPTAIASTILWALFTPIDSDIQEAIGGWNAAKTNLEGVTGGTWEGIAKTLDKNWEGDSKSAFDNWAEIFKKEVEQTAAAADKNSQALTELVQQLHFIQNAMFGFAMISLAAIIAFSIGENTPYVGIFFRVAKLIQGAILSAGTAASVTAVLGVAGIAIGPLQDIASAAGLNFAKLEVNLGGGTSFKDINIDWAQPTVPVPQA